MRTSPWCKTHAAAFAIVQAIHGPEHVSLAFGIAPLPRRSKMTADSAGRSHRDSAVARGAPEVCADQRDGLH